MPGYFGVQLSLELSNILLLRNLAQASYNKILNLARDLRNSGSDIVVEEDLAQIFGRGRVSPDLEEAFKAAVHVHKITPLYQGSEVELHQGPGPTLLRAFQEKRYFATVLTLSMLGYFHERNDLATLISKAMDGRHEANLPDSTYSPGFEGIVGTLQACSCQCSEFQWMSFRQGVENKFFSAIPNYQHSPDYYRIPQTVFQGAVDFFYIVQSLPEDRKVVISNQAGCIPLIIWSHNVLGLTVAITNLPNGNVVFGKAPEPQIYITWSAKKQSDDSSLNSNYWSYGDGMTGELDPVVRLLDKDMMVILSCEPHMTDTFSRTPQERHTLEGYGTTFLHRILNRDFITREEDPMYSEMAFFVTGLAIRATQVMNEGGWHRFGGPLEFPSGLYRPLELEVFRTMASAKVLFHGIAIDASRVSTYADFLSTNILDEAGLPVTFNKFLGKVNVGPDSVSAAELLIDHIKFLAQIVLVFAHVIDLEKCIDIPLIMTDEIDQLSRLIDLVCTAPDAQETVEPHEIFHAIAGLLCSDFSFRDDIPGFGGNSNFLFLVSDFGWSVHLSTVGAQDPASVRPEFIHVRKGTPTNAKTKERKLRMRDGITIGEDPALDGIPLERKPDFEPRPVAKLVQRTDYWVSRLREFELTVQATFNLAPDLENHVGRPEARGIFKPRTMYESLSKTFSTPCCKHKPRVDGSCEAEPKVRVGPDVFVYQGGGVTKSFDDRIVMLSTGGEPYLRWMAIQDRAHISDFTVDADASRVMMLRSNRCCNSCALNFVASLEGKWALIL